MTQAKDVYTRSLDLYLKLELDSIYSNLAKVQVLLDKLEHLLKELHNIALMEMP